MSRCVTNIGFFSKSEKKKRKKNIHFKTKFWAKKRHEFHSNNFLHHSRIKIRNRKHWKKFTVLYGYTEQVLKRIYIYICEKKYVNIFLLMLIHLKAYADLFIIEKIRKTRQRKCNMTRVTQWQFSRKNFRSICARLHGTWHFNGKIPYFEMLVAFCCCCRRCCPYALSKAKS